MPNPTKKCKLCNNPILVKDINRIYCGKIYQKNTCSWKVAKLQQRLISIKQRVLNPKHENYVQYKNLDIEKEWLENSFKFVSWAIKNGWNKKLQIDRIDNEKGYLPSNCRFVTPSENQRNRRNNVTNWLQKKRRCRICRTIKPFKDMMTSRKEVGGIAYECRLCRKKIDYLRYKKISKFRMKMK